MRTCLTCNKEYQLSDDGAGYKYCSQDCSDEARRIRNRDRWRSANPGWDNGTNKVCECCGQAYTVPARNANQAKFCSNECQQTWYSREVRKHGTREEYNNRRAKESIVRQEALAKNKTFKSLRSSLLKAIKVKENEEKIKRLTRECDECGRLFYHPHPSTVTCSKECSRKRKNRVSKILEGSRINKRNLVDKGITLKKLYKRDKGKCYLCGDVCDFNDMEITTHGHYIVGPTYPSIDHVKPLSKGGKHSWRNVKLTHHSCNTHKNDKYVNEYLDEVA